MSIQRYNHAIDWLEPDPDGEYVTYADHLADRDKLHQSWSQLSRDNYDAGHADGAQAERERIVEAVKALNCWAYVGEYARDAVLYEVLAAVEGSET